MSGMITCTSSAEAEQPPLTLQRLRELMTEMKSVTVPLEIRVTASDLIPVGRQVFVNRGEIVGFAADNEWPGGHAEWDEVVVHPDRYAAILEAVAERKDRGG